MKHKNSHGHSQNKPDYSLYLVTDRDLMSTSSIEESVELAIKGGCTIVQLREKNLTSSDFYQTAVEIKKITKQYSIPLIINDRADIALAIDADGVHVGQSDIPANAVRKIIGDRKILGVSVSTLEEAIEAEKNGANYLGVGALFSTETKADSNLVTMETLQKIIKATSLPIVVIGGINKNTIPLFSDAKIDGIAVVSAIISEKNITKATLNLKKLFTEIIKTGR